MPLFQVAQKPGQFHLPTRAKGDDDDLPHQGFIFRERSKISPTRLGNRGHGTAKFLVEGWQWRWFELSINQGAARSMQCPLKVLVHLLSKIDDADDAPLRVEVLSQLQHTADRIRMGGGSQQG